MNRSLAVPKEGNRADSSSSVWRRSVATLAGRAAVLIGAVAWIATAAAADDNKIIFPGGGKTASAPASSGGASANTITLVVALAMAAFGAWLFWRNRRTAGASRESRLLAVEETRSLGNRQYLVVASYEGRKFLLGVCPGRIDMLAPLQDGKGQGN